MLDILKLISGKIFIFTVGQFKIIYSFFSVLIQNS